MIVEKFSRLPRKSSAPAAVDDRGRPKSRRGRSKLQGPLPVPAQQREAILATVPARIMAGATLSQVAAEHGIGYNTLQMWLHNLGEEYQALRRLWVAQMLVQAQHDLNEKDETGAAALRLARARERTRLAQWYAERLDRARYGDIPTPITQVPVFQVIVTVAGEPQASVAAPHDEPIISGTVLKTTQDT